MKSIISLASAFAAFCAFGQNLDSNQSARVSAMHECAVAGDLDKLKELLDLQPGLVNAKKQFPQTRKPSRGDGYTAMMRAADEGREKIVAYLIERGADVNASDGMGWTVLHLAARRGNLTIVKALIKNGAKVDAKTVWIPEWTVPSGPPNEPPKTYEIPSRSPMDLAVMGNHSEVVAYLKSVGAK